MDLLLSNKVAIVTGASRGIGKSIAETLSAERVKVILVARSRATLESLAKSFEIARAVAFLASPQAAYIQGALLDVDGGATRIL